MRSAKILPLGLFSFIAFISLHVFVFLLVVSPLAAANQIKDSKDIKNLNTESSNNQNLISPEELHPSYIQAKIQAKTSSASFRSALTEEIFPELKTLRQIAQEKSPAAFIRHLSEKEAKEQLKASRGNLYPSLYSEFNAIHTEEDREDFPSLVSRDRYSFATTLSYPLYHWGAPSAEARRGHELMTQARLQNTFDWQSQQAELSDVYWNLMIKNKELELAASDMESAERQMKGNELSDSVSRSTVGAEDLQLRYQQAGLQLERKKTEYELLKNKLRRIAGDSPELERLSFDYSHLPEKLELPLFDNLKNSNNSNNSNNTPTIDIHRTLAVENYQSQARQQKAEAAIALAEVRPHVDWLLGVYQDQVDSVNVSKSIDRTNYFTGVRVSWQLFNGFRSSASSAASKIRQQRLNALAQQELLRAKEELASNLSELKLAKADYEIAYKKRKFALVSLEEQTRLKEKGQASAEDYAQARKNLNLADVSALQALTHFLTIYEKVENILAES